MTKSSKYNMIIVIHRSMGRPTCNCDSPSLSYDAEKKSDLFLSQVEVTSGGDTPEAYELVLHQVRTELSWTPGSQRSLVMIGDNIPHEANYRRNKLKLDWRKEADALNGMVSPKDPLTRNCSVRAGRIPLLQRK